MVFEDFNHTIDFWITALERYDFVLLCTAPSPNNWSPGQLYLHLINDTNFYIEQIKICISANDNAMEEASPAAKTMFLNNDFPDEIIKGAPANSCIPQPGNKEDVADSLLNLKAEIRTVGILISTSRFKGKTKHPGLGYFNANEWFQFAEMHFRHHLKQKKKIDIFLKIDTV